MLFICQQFKTTGKVDVHKRARRRRIPETAPILCDQVKLDPSMTLQEMGKAKITVTRALTKMKWKEQTMIRIPDGRNTAENI